MGVLVIGSGPLAESFSECIPSVFVRSGNEAVVYGSGGRDRSAKVRWYGIGDHGSREAIASGFDLRVPFLPMDERFRTNFASNTGYKP